MKSLSTLVLALLTAPAFLPAQTPWPLGCPVPVTVANNGTTPLQYQPCTPIVTDAQGNFVSIGLCLQVIVFLPPGATETTYWNQYDFTGQPAPPGLYFVNGQPFVTGAVDMAVEPLGAPHVGFTRNVEVCAADGAGLPYVLAASFSSLAGIPLCCGRVFPLDPDPLLDASLSSPAVFADFVGLLDQYGRSTAPAITLPPLPWLVGIPFELAALTLDGAASCGIGAISPPRAVTIE